MIVSNAIIQAHKGKIWVRSTGVPGEGCVFGVDIDIAGTVDSLSAVTRQSISSFSRYTHLSSSQLSIADMSDIHALVVDDSRVTRKLFSNHLKAFGVVNIQQASDGLEAVRAVDDRMISKQTDTKPFDVIFMDWHMPGMDGKLATIRMRELGFIGAIIIVTGDGLPEDINEIMASGATQVLVKPINVAQIEKCLQGKQYARYRGLFLNSDNILRG